MEKICENCKNWGDNPAFGMEDRISRRCYSTEYYFSRPNMSCPLFDATIEAIYGIPLKLIDWKPVWHSADTPPKNIENVLTLNLAEKWQDGDYFKVEFFISGIWYKRAGSRTNAPDYWTELPEKG